MLPKTPAQKPTPTAEKGSPFLQRFRFREIRKTAGLTLTELLIVIAVMGILTAVAMPVISGLNDTANESRDRTNAQNIASVSASLAALGAIHVFPPSLGGKDATVKLLREGVTITEGPFVGQKFMIRALSDEEITFANEYLEIVSDSSELRLVYKPGLL